jgi:hypothetical protein
MVPERVEVVLEFEQAGRPPGTSFGRLTEVVDGVVDTPQAGEQAGAPITGPLPLVGVAGPLPVEGGEGVRKVAVGVAARRRLSTPS